MQCAIPALLRATTVLALLLAPAARALDAVGVLTPGTPQRWSASVGGLLKIVDPWGDEDKAARLKQLAREDRFDLALRLQKHLLEAIATRGALAVPVNLVRPPQLQPKPLARDLLPQAPLPGVLLDATVEWFGVHTRGITHDYQPWLLVSFRTVDAHGGVVLATRRVYYNRIAGADLPVAESIAADENCKWEKFADVVRDRQRLWGCFDTAIEKIAVRIAEQVTPKR